MEVDYINELKKGSLSWNEFRKTKEGKRPVLRDLDFFSTFSDQSNPYNLPEFDKNNFSNCDLHGCSFRNCSFIKLQF